MSCWSATTAGIWAKRSTGAKVPSGSRPPTFPSLSAARESNKAASAPNQSASSMFTRLWQISQKMNVLNGSTDRRIVGLSSRVQLATPLAARRPAISSYGEGNTSIRTQHWRYIRYEDASEELYDHNEWTNLANKSEHKETRQKLAKMTLTNQHPGLEVQSRFDKFQK